MERGGKSSHFLVSLLVLTNEWRTRAIGCCHEQECFALILAGSISSAYLVPKAFPDRVQGTQDTRTALIRITSLGRGPDWPPFLAATSDVSLRLPFGVDRLPDYSIRWGLTRDRIVLHCRRRSVCIASVGCGQRGCLFDKSLSRGVPTLLSGFAKGEQH